MRQSPTPRQRDLRQYAADFTADGLLNNSAAGILAKRVVVGPQSSATITFCVSWTNVNNGYYRNFFTDAQVLATYGRDSAVVLKAKVDNWHNKILNSNLPDWLKDLTINCLHVYNSMTDWVTPNTYGMAESMSSGIYGTNDQAYHASFALPVFAPDAEWSQVERMATTAQQANGLFGHTYGFGDGVRSDVGQKFILEFIAITNGPGTRHSLPRGIPISAMPFQAFAARTRTTTA